MTVDSRPYAVGPPSRISAMPSPKSAYTCAARVGLRRPERLAEGAASGRSAARSSACATGWSGTRMATLSRPALTSSDSFEPARRRKHQGQRTGPERFGEALRERRHLGVLAGLRGVRYVHDQRVEAGAPLGREDRRHRAPVGGIAAEPIDGLGREGDKAALPQQRRRGRDSFLRCLHNGHRLANSRGPNLGHLPPHIAERAEFCPNSV